MVFAKILSLVIFLYLNQFVETRSNLQQTKEINSSEIVNSALNLNEQEELLFVAEINRHGARTAGSFPNLTQQLFYGSSSMQLTINGYEMNELLGSWVRERYNSILPLHYDESIKIRSSPYQRTFFSASAWSNGVFKNSYTNPIFIMSNGSKISNRITNNPPVKNFSLQNPTYPVNIEIGDINNDYLFHSLKCDYQNKTVSSYLEKESIYNITKDDIKYVIDEMKTRYPKFFIEKNKDFYTLKFLADLNSFITPVNYQFNNTFFDLSNRTQYIFKQIQVAKWYEMRLKDSIAKKIAVTGYFDDILANFEAAPKKLKFTLFSAHDSSIVDILSNILRVDVIEDKLNNLEVEFDFLQPPFASSLFFELYTSKIYGKYVRILYNGEYIHSLTQMKVDSKINAILYENFVNFISTRRTDEYYLINCRYAPENK